LVEALDANSVPNDGMRYGVLTPRAYAQAMTVESFASSDYVGANGLPFGEGIPGHRMFREWMNVKWCMLPNLPGQGTSTAKIFVYHKNAIGYAIQKAANNVASNENIAADITWHGDRAAYFINHVMSGGAVMIDDTGVIEAMTPLRSRPAKEDLSWLTKKQIFPSWVTAITGSSGSTPVLPTTLLRSTRAATSTTPPTCLMSAT
jgi:hypothetical protein